MHEIKTQIKTMGLKLGFQEIAITDTDLSKYELRFQHWLNKKFHGDMYYMEKHGTKRTRPQELIEGTIRIISVRMDYLPPNTHCFKVLNNPQLGFISRYALGKDYHRVMRKRLQKLTNQIKSLIGPFGYRVFTDSAPVLEKPIAEKAGLGWIGKHTNLINKKAGSYFFLGEIYTDLPLTIDSPSIKSHCGSCTSCITICPTKAIVAPYALDARRCISYLTIELKDHIPIALRPLIGNRIYGCDDCQLVCPWNKFAKFTKEDAFYPRKDLIAPDLLHLFDWDEKIFLKQTENSAIRRIGFERFIRNVTVALGNAPYSENIVAALKQKLTNATPLIAEHIDWAIQSQLQKSSHDNI